MMSPSKLIIDINRSLDPSPFNTGPPIPTVQNVSDAVSIDTLRALPSYGVPDLSASPASSCGSSLHSLSLEDEEIKKIFAPSIQSLRNDVYQGFDNICTPPEVEYFSSKEQLNPHAAPFIPSSERVSPPAKLVAIDPSFQPSPLNLGFEPINFMAPPLVQEQSPDTQYSPYHNCIPLPPRSASLHHPEFDQREPPVTIEAPLQSSPVYLPLFTEAFHPKTTNRMRQVLAHAIVNACPANWDLETLLDLGKRIAIEASRPVSDNQVNDGLPVFPCDSARYKLGEGGAQSEGDEEDSSSRLEIMVADISLYLYDHFLSVGEELGQAFGWNLRESVLRKFISYWDESTETAVSFRTCPTVEYVRSALAICKSIGALFTRNLITHQHISMCISILMKRLVSVEHLEALANLVLGAGPTFWKVTSTESGFSEAETEADPAVLPLIDGSLLFSTDSNLSQTRHQTSHVDHFLECLKANVWMRDLTGEVSVVNMGWTQSQFNARVLGLATTVKNWAS